jgi:hypothetical protein
MNKDVIIEALKSGNYNIRLDSDCGCNVDWEITNNHGVFELHPDICSDTCWVGTILEVNGVNIAENIAFESIESLVDSISTEEIKEIFFEATGKELADEMGFDENNTKNATHDKNLRESLIEFIVGSEYRCFIRYPRNFGNEYDCILVDKNAAEEDIPDNVSSLTPEEMADKFLASSTPVTDYWIGFDFVK